MMARHQTLRLQLGVFWPETGLESPNSEVFFPAYRQGARLDFVRKQANRGLLCHGGSTVVLQILGATLSGSSQILGPGFCQTQIFGGNECT
jgi:hypothetical protein